MKANVHRAKPKPEWSDYLTEDNRFALTKEEILKKKQLLVSRHNILNGTSKISTPSPKATTKNKTSSPKNPYSAGSYSGAKARKGNGDITALDLLSESFETTEGPDSMERTKLLRGNKPYRNKINASSMIKKSRSNANKYIKSKAGEDSDFDTSAETAQDDDVVNVGSGSDSEDETSESEDEDEDEDDEDEDEDEDDIDSDDDGNANHRRSFHTSPEKL
jgi:hypothetical protein